MEEGSLDQKKTLIKMRNLSYILWEGRCLRKIVPEKHTREKKEPREKKCRGGLAEKQRESILGNPNDGGWDLATPNYGKITILREERGGRNGRKKNRNARKKWN